MVQALDEEVRLIESTTNAQKMEAEVTATTFKQKQLIEELTEKLLAKVSLLLAEMM
jgi:hypothetical protein